MHGMPAILQINTERHTDDGILFNDTRMSPKQMATSIEAATQTYRHNLKAIILNVPDARLLACELKMMDGIPIYCLHAAAYLEVVVTQWDLTHRFCRFYMRACLNFNDVRHHMQDSDFATNAQSLYHLAMCFVQKVPRNDEPDPNYAEGMEIIKKECKNIIDILEQTTQRDIRQLMNIYLPRTPGVTDETVKRIHSKEGGIVTVMCHFGGHVECKKTITMPNGGTS